ncbi:hypothetical protein [Marinospirillum perlucidum]|uniref:hypothetical protein n=1 Tax=Marinospirillum perlucidum TaxID=1982602 RepID=UPI000DF43E90|nr:hypothetical protein [Marinospirillum perlucidum]
MRQLAAQQRYATLKAMGINLWVPRHRLPFAAPSPQCDWPEPVRVSAREQLRAELDTTTAPAANPPAPARVATPAEQQPEVPEPPVAATPSEKPVKTEGQIPPLMADVWLLANGWQLVMEKTAPLEQSSLQLVQNLLAALYPGGLGIISQQSFHWPLPGIPLDRGDEEELNASLRAFLSGPQFQPQPVGILALGERLETLLQTERAPALAEVYALPSLEQLLARPESKKQLWDLAGQMGLRARFASSPVLL